MGALRKNPILPAEYQQVEYIQGSINAYLNTGVPFYKNTIYADVQFPYGILAHGVGITGSMANKNFYLQRNMNYGNSVQITVGNKDVWHSSSGLNDRIKILFNTAEGKLFVNDIEVTPNNPMDGTQSTSPQNIYLFARNISGSASDAGHGVAAKVFRFTIWNKTTGDLLRDFVPCYRKADEVIGFYDLATQSFFTKSGSSDFEKGEDV